MKLVGDIKGNRENVMYVERMSFKGVGSNGLRIVERSKEYSFIIVCFWEGNI